MLKIFPFDRSSLKIAVTAVLLLGLAAAARRWIAVPRDWYWTVATFALCYAVAGGVTFLLGTEPEDRFVWSTVLGKLRRRAS